MSEQRLDLKSRGIGCFAYMDVWAEALRAQSSKDALRERVRVLEDVIRDFNFHCGSKGARLQDEALGGGKGSE